MNLSCQNKADEMAYNKIKIYFAYEVSFFLFSSKLIRPDFRNFSFSELIRKKSIMAFC